MQDIYLTFEFIKIQEAISEYHKSEIAKEKIDSLKMFSSKEEVKNALLDLEEISSLLLRFGPLPISNSANALYLIDLAKRHGTVTAILKSLVKMQDTLIRSVSYRQSGSKLKESIVCSMSEKNMRLEKIQQAKFKLDAKFADIRKRDKVDQKIKNEKYWEEHQEEKAQLLEERSKLDHEVFELENSKLKMPKLTELKKLEEEAIRLQVLKDNTTYTGKERTAFMEELGKTRKLITTKKREIANIINPIDERIEKLKKRIYNIDKELNQNR